MTAFTDDELNIIASTPLFKGIPVETVSRLLTGIAVSDRSFKKSESVYTVSNFRNELGIVLSGQLRVTKGEGSLVVSRLGAGSIFGAAALFNEQPEYVSCLTVGKDSRILFIPQDSVRILIDSDAAVRMNYIRYLSERIRFLSSKVDSLISPTGEDKLADWLAKQMEADGCIHMTYSMTELAKRLHVGRATLYRELDRLSESGIIAREGHELHILKPELLKTR